MDLKNTHPLELIERLILLESIHSIEPKTLRAFAPDCVNSIEEIDEDNNTTYVLVVDWEKLLFNKSNIDLQKIMSNFVPKQVKKSSGIILP